MGCLLMVENTTNTSSEFDLRLRDLVTKRKFSELALDDALLFFCKTLSDTLNVPRVGIWVLSENREELHGKVLWDRTAGFTEPRATLNVDNAPSYMEAVNSEIVVTITDALRDPRCTELASDYLPSTNVSALLDCPIRTFGGLVGVVCIEHTGQPHDWTQEEINFGLAVTSLVSLTFEHNEREIAEKSRQDLEARITAYTDLAADWFWETDEEFVFQVLHGNDSRDGQVPKSYIGQKIWEVPLLTPHDGNWDILKAKVNTKKRIFDFVIFAKDEAGDKFYAELSGVPKIDADGNYTGYWGTAKDVTRRMRQEQRLVDSDRRYKNAARLAGIGNWIWDEISDSCAYCSPELARMYGYSVNDFLKRAKSAELELEWCYPEDRERYHRVISKAQKDETGYEIRSRIVRSDGSVRTMHEITEAVFDENGQFIATAGVIRDITEQVEMRDNLKLQSDRLSSIVDNIPGAAYRVKYDGKFTNVYRSEGYLNRFVNSNLTLAQLPLHQDLPSLNIQDLASQQIDELLRQSVSLNQPYSIEYAVTLADGSERWVADFGRPVLADDGEIELEGIMIDVSEKHAAQVALAQGQRLEAIGKLTGGMAHDFNNLLAILLGNLELLRDEISVSDHLEMIDAGINAVQRGSDLTKNMLAFARESKLNMVTLDINDLARNAKSWIGRTLPENIVVETSLLAGLWKTKADASSTESAILNLIINARDAMPEGGKLTIETSNVRIDEDYARSRHEDIEPGRYVMLAISDTGHGIPTENLENIFVPFFTTKPPGSGSGLGLSMIVGFMKQSGGSVRVYSEENVGTTFKLYFKAITNEAVFRVSNTGNNLPFSHGNAKILVVEDEQDVLDVLKAILTGAGYSIRWAVSGNEALKVFEEDPQFDILLTDIVMPGTLQGTTLAKVLREREPNLRVVFMSGYASESTVHGNGLRPEDIRLMKPVRQVDLINAIEKSLAN
jgi:PAS domain S-box-containing protein